MASNPDYNERATLGGNQVNMPHWNDLTGNRQPLSDSAPLVPAKLVADQDIARIHNDGNAWSWNHLASVVAGDDPALALADFMAAYWNRQNQYMLIVPKAVVQATCELARELLLVDRTAAPAGEGLKYQNVGGNQTGYDKSDRRPIISAVAQAMLRKLGALVNGKSGVVRLVRA